MILSKLAHICKLARASLSAVHGAATRERACLDRLTDAQGQVTEVRSAAGVWEDQPCTSIFLEMRSAPRAVENRAMTLQSITLPMCEKPVEGVCDTNFACSSL